jgi:hypothetical protein
VDWYVFLAFPVALVVGFVVVAAAAVGVEVGGVVEISVLENAGAVSAG